MRLLHIGNKNGSVHLIFKIATFALLQLIGIHLSLVLSRAVLRLLRMRLLKLGTLFLAAHSCAEVAFYTFDQVEPQISLYLELVRNGTLTTRGQSPTGCALAVRILSSATS